MRRRLFHGLLLSALLAATFAWVALDKTVSVEVDGVPRSVRTYARTVGGVLDQMGVRVGEHDLLAPARPVAVRGGSRIVLRRGRQLTLMVNGRPRSVWVTALSVDEALRQIGLRTDGAFVSASRSRGIPLVGMAMEVRLPARVRVLDAGRARTLVTTAATVADLLADAGLRLAPADRVSVPLDRYPAHGTTVAVTRIRDREQVETRSIPFAVERRPDPTMWTDTSRVVQEGRPGVRVLTFAVTYVDGRVSRRQLLRDVVTARPRAQVVVYGTRKRTVDSLNWWALAQCESGNNPRAVSGNGLYRGLYQFRLSTWRGVGGAGDPIDASREEQTYRAKRLYLRAGASPWPHCGYRLYR